VTLAGRIFDKLDVSRFHGDLFSARHLKLSPAAERNHVLAARSSMPIANPTGRRAMELPSGDPHLEDIIGIAWREFGLYFLGVRLAIRPGVEPSEENGFAFLSSARIASGLRRQYQNKQAQQTSSD